jgi:hypothetical protein
MYWAILYNPAFAEPSASNVTAHGGLCLALVVDLLAAARLPVGGAFDFLVAFAFLLAYLAFNVAFTLGGATNQRRGRVRVRDPGVAHARGPRGHRRRVCRDW